MTHFWRFGGYRKWHFGWPNQNSKTTFQYKYPHFPIDLVTQLTITIKLQKLESWHWGIVIYNQIVTWTAFAILAMFFIWIWIQNAIEMNILITTLTEATMFRTWCCCTSCCILPSICRQAALTISPPHTWYSMYSEYHIHIHIGAQFAKFHNSICIIMQR